MKNPYSDITQNHHDQYNNKLFWEVIWVVLEKKPPLTPQTPTINEESPLALSDLPLLTWTP